MARAGQAATGYALRVLPRATQHPTTPRKEERAKVIHSRPSNVGFRPWLKIESARWLKIQSARTLQPASVKALVDFLAARLALV